MQSSISGANGFWTTVGIFRARVFDDDFAMRIHARHDVDQIELLGREHLIDADIPARRTEFSRPRPLPSAGSVSQTAASKAPSPARSRHELRWLRAKKPQPTSPMRVRSAMAPAQAAATIVLRRMPMPSASISTTSPAFIKICGFWKTPTPAGVPVVTMSPGNSVMVCDR